MVQLGGFWWLSGTVSRFYQLFLVDQGGTAASNAQWIGVGAFSLWWLASTSIWLVWAAAIHQGPRWFGGWNSVSSRVLWAAATFMVIEAYGPRIFPWSLGAGCSEIPWLAQGAWYVGVEGLSALVIIIAVLCAEGWESRLRRRSIWGGAASILLLWTVLGGIRHEGSVEGEGVALRVGYVQAGVSLERRHSRDRRVQLAVLEEIEERTVELATRTSPDVVVWSEGMLPSLWSDSELASWLGDRQIDTPLIIGGLGKEGGAAVNRAFLYLDPATGTLAHYDKRALIPFGETIPLRGVLRTLGIPLPAAQLAAGTESGIFNFEGVPVGISICFEGILPGVADELREGGALLHVNLTEDLWYGDSSAPYQHLALTRMRAVEAGVPLVRVTNGGISAACDARGRWLEQIALGERQAGVFELSLPTRLEEPPFSRWCVSVVPIIGIPLLLLVSRIGLGKRSRGFRPNSGS